MSDTKTAGRPPFYLECPNCKKMCIAHLDPDGWVYFCRRCWEAQDYDLRGTRKRIQPEIMFPKEEK
jgi:hypothetical protein